MKSVPSEKDKAVSRDHLRIALPLVIMGVSFLVFLLAQFRLSAWAEASELHHIGQHVLIFLAGVGIGGSGIDILKPR